MQGLGEGETTRFGRRFWTNSHGFPPRPLPLPPDPPAALFFRMQLFYLEARFTFLSMPLSNKSSPTEAPSTPIKGTFQTESLLGLDLRIQSAPEHARWCPRPHQGCGASRRSKRVGTFHTSECRPDFNRLCLEATGHRLIRCYTSRLVSAELVTHP